MKQSTVLSTTLHGLLMVVVIWGLPFVKRPELDVPPSIQVDVITVSDMPNAAPNNQNQSKTPPTPTPTPPKDEPPPKPELLAPTPPEAPPQPPKPQEPPPPQPPAPKPPEPVPQPPVPKPPEPKPPEPKPVEPPKPDPVPTPKPPEPKPVEKPPEKPPEKKPDPKPPEPKPTPKPPEPKKDDFFDMMNNAVKDNKPAPKPTPTPPKPVAGPPQQQVAQGTPSAPKSSGPSNPDRPLSRSEQNGVREAIQPCWSFDGGTAGSGSMQIEVRIFLERDSTIKGAELVDPSIVNRSPAYRAAAMAALRATKNPRCNKLPVTLGEFNSMVLNFDPKDMGM
ncbi:hypothetical protein ACFSM5_12085 [Lacibacterium aquatile]|uniref:Cell division and transport-associated protein TolA n=1 Tax=Lacibacterium aquatile TaxID=1168082 RepID=A0ABW5DS39_9PROT